MKIFVYFFLVLLTIVIADFFYFHSGLYERDAQKCDATLTARLDSIKADTYLYLGESSNFTYHPLDTNKMSISQIVSKETGFDITDLSKPAIHAGTYKQLINRIPENFKKIRGIIVTVNLRSFGINWIESKLESNISRANIFYSSYPVVIKKFLLSFKGYDNKEIFQRNDVIKWHYKHDKFYLPSKSYQTIEEWDRDVYSKGIKDSTGRKKQTETDLACHFIKNYAFVLTEQNKRIKDLDEIAEFCENRGIKLIFHILPENYQLARKYFGTDLETLMRANISFLYGRYYLRTKFINNFDLLRDDCFIDRNWPTEHYNYFGRKKIASTIKASMQ